MKNWKLFSMLLFLFEIPAAHAQDSMTAGAVLKRYNGGVQISGQFTVPKERMLGGACLAAQLESKFAPRTRTAGLRPTAAMPTASSLLRLT
jgi:hypothetical protein